MSHIIVPTFLLQCFSCKEILCTCEVLPYPHHRSSCQRFGTSDIFEDGTPVSTYEQFAHEIHEIEWINQHDVEV